MQNFLRDYGTGLELVRVNVESTQPPAPVQDAFREVQRAREDEQRVKEEAETYRNRIVPEARGEAQRMIEEANAYKEEVIERARGETARFLQLLAVYEMAPTVTRERLYLQTVEQVLASSSKILVDTESSGNMMYLPLDRLTQGSLPRTGGSSSGSNQGNVDIQSLTDQVLQELRSRQDTTVRRSR